MDLDGPSRGRRRGFLLCERGRWQIECCIVAGSGLDTRQVCGKARGKVGAVRITTPTGILWRSSCGYRAGG
jgi:hypothetical protein